jgi:hypothetical protein
VQLLTLSPPFRLTSFSLLLHLSFPFISFRFPFPSSKRFPTIFRLLFFILSFVFFSFVSFLILLSFSSFFFFLFFLYVPYIPSFVTSIVVLESAFVLPLTFIYRNFNYEALSGNQHRYSRFQVRIFQTVYHYDEKLDLQKQGRGMGKTFIPKQPNDQKPQAWKACSFVCLSCKCLTLLRPVNMCFLKYYQLLHCRPIKTPELPNAKRHRNAPIASDIITAAILT